MTDDTEQAGGPSLPDWPLPPVAAPAPRVPVPVPTAAPVPPAAPVPAAPPVPAAAPAAPAAPRARSWVGVAAVAALVGAAVGAGVTALADNGDTVSNVTIHESNSAPGAAVLSGNVTIPELVKKVSPAVVSIDVKSNGNEDQGTGMIITADGEVVTNNHVIELYTDGGDTGSITVTEYGQKNPIPPPSSATTRSRTSRCSRSTTLPRACPPSPSAARPRPWWAMRWWRSATPWAWPQAPRR